MVALRVMFDSLISSPHSGPALIYLIRRSDVGLCLKVSQTKLVIAVDSRQ